MRKVAMVLAAGLLAAAVGWSAMPAGASAPAKDTKFCKATSKLTDQIDALPANANGIDKKAAAKTAKTIKVAANSAPPKVKKAMLVFVRVYQRVAKGDALTSILADNGLDFAKAASTFGAYFVKNCVKTP
jgi:hypothetical protein